jgi:hypothetical protein
MRLSRLALFSLFVLPVACQEQPPQTGHRVIAAAIRTLLDQAYADVDARTYQQQMQALESIVAEQKPHAPRELHKTLEGMLGYLRTAADILHWQAEHPNTAASGAEQPIVGWTKRYSFLEAAVGAQASGVFDPSTAVTLLWDKTNQLLPQLQIKSKPL